MASHKSKVQLHTGDDYRNIPHYKFWLSVYYGVRYLQLKLDD